MSLVMNEIRYLQVAATLAQAIEKGSLLAGSRLPSVRSYAKNLQVSINTVVAAYRTLEDRGLIEARPQSGFYVCSPSTAVVPTATVGKPVDEVLDLIDTVFAAQQNTRFTNISLACPQTGDFYPSAKLGRIMASLLRREPQLISQYALPPGSQRLRQQIARRAMTLGMLANPADITITHGCMEALQLALRVTTKPGDCVGLESPTYFYLMPLLASLGLKAVEIPTDSQQGLSLDVLELLLKEGRLNALIAMPTVQNPMGFTMPLAAKKRLAQLMNDHQVPLIEDGLYAEIQFGSTLSPAVKAFDRDGWILFCSSFTKTLAPDFRVGWIDGGRFTEDLHKLKAVSSMAESTLLSETLALFLKSGGYDHHLRSLRRRYAQQVQQAQQLIPRHFPYGTKVTQPAGGFVFWVEFPDSVDTVALFHQMLKEQICLTPGTLYSPSGRYRHAFRLSCCYPFNQRYTEALARLGAVACDISGLPAGMRWPSLEADTMERPVF
ncbi:PLP-dependent aminotransferase family protein [Yersinia frederiksenii]|uniref:aminotransferase-like domain-containing protein n=1 Tax=Yersinia frederiksenii TaxID=29484 RepID=UPI0005E771A3|nr:PLP-dependent aminotransferase family protein [Yersinia frederiksenii]CFR30657.1 putative transcriptional regulator [Yersinia frederiksenii]